MKSVVHIAIVLIAAIAPAFATDTLNFNGQGYSLGVIVGGVKTAQITDVHLSILGTDKAFHIPSTKFKVKRISYPTQVLVLEYLRLSPNDPPSFRLKVKHNKGLLTINGKSVLGEFDWIH